MSCDRVQKRVQKCADALFWVVPVDRQRGEMELLAQCGQEITAFNRTFKLSNELF